ncbi:hypothetical protein HK405_015256, partial [Cladochytrium tenue]
MVTGDFESLKHLARKVRRADDSLLYPQSIWQACFEANVKLLELRCPESRAALRQLASTFTPATLAARAPDVELVAFSSPVVKVGAASPPDTGPDFVALLAWAFQLRRLNEGDMDESKLVDIMVGIYCAAFLHALETRANGDGATSSQAAGASPPADAALDNDAEDTNSSQLFGAILKRIGNVCKTLQQRPMRASMTTTGAPAAEGESPGQGQASGGVDEDADMDAGEVAGGGDTERELGDGAGAVEAGAEVTAGSCGPQAREEELGVAALSAGPVQGLAE